jgi:hypothetical protein
MLSKITMFILLVIGILISSYFYTIGSYYFRYAETMNLKFRYIFIISLICGIISYSIKIPLYYYLGKYNNIMMINILYITITFIIVTLYSKYILKENIPLHTYIIIFIILLLLIFNSLLDIYEKNKN